MSQINTYKYITGLNNLRDSISELLHEVKNDIEFENSSKEEIKAYIEEKNEEFKNNFLSNLNQEEQLFFSENFTFEEVSFLIKKEWMDSAKLNANWEYQESLEKAELEGIKDSYSFEIYKNEEQMILEAFELSLEPEELELQNLSKNELNNLKSKLRIFENESYFETIQNKIKGIEEFGKLISPNEENTRVDNMVRIGGGSFTDGKIQTGLFEFMIDEEETEREVSPELASLNGLLSHEYMHSHFTPFEVSTNEEIDRQMEEKHPSLEIQINEEETEREVSPELASLNGLLSHEYMHSHFTPFEIPEKIETPSNGEDENEDKIDLDF